MSRYARQTILPEVGSRGQRRLAAARMLAVGAGGLAAPALPLLAGAGIGHLTIMDGDAVEISNLHRQTLFTEADVGQSKATAAAARCRALNSDITVNALPCPLNPANAEEHAAAADVVLDCADSYAASYLLSDACLTAGTPLISASATGAEGYVGGFCGSAPSLRAVFSEVPDSGANCATAGVLGPVVGILGAMQAQMALNFVLRTEPSPLGQFTRFNGISMRTASFRFDGAAEPETFFRFAGAAQLRDTDLIFDLRDAAEAPDPIDPRARRSSPDGIKTLLADRRPGKSARLALCCATGLRAWRAAEAVQPCWSGEIILVAAVAS